jgi:UDP-N-acetylglucosamine/UDP-N-acetylgalactosamine diphosphorylase
MMPDPLTYFKQNEPQLFRFWLSLTPPQQLALENQLKSLSIELLEKQKLLIINNLRKTDWAACDVFDDFAYAGNPQNQERGLSLIEQGKLGCLILAGGQGTRLQCSGPKGTYPLSVIKQKSLFQLCAEKVCAAGVLAGRPLSLAIMTSPDNDKETRLFFEEHHYFGLLPSQVSFFVQGTLPLLDATGHLFLSTPWQIVTGAEGNGESLLHFVRSGIWEKWSQQGIEYVHVVPVDNPLADPFDPELLGFHVERHLEVTLKCTEKTQPEEQVGVLVKQEGHTRVIEYTEMPETDKQARGADGHLTYCCANLSLFCFSLSFIQRLAHQHHTLPLHLAWKAAHFVDEKGQSHLSSTPRAWKFETFIFDWLEEAHHVAALLYPRNRCFAPLKNLTGPDSPETVRAALQQADRTQIEALTGLPPPNFPFELAASFHYPTPEIREKWKGRPVTTAYVETY